MKPKNSVAAVTGFYKDVENFLVNTVENRVLPIADSDNLFGLGDSYNVLGFYSEGPLEVRVAWNRRERFLRTAVGFGGEPTFVQPYQQIDARASYAITDHFSVFAEGVNLGNEIQERVGRYDNQILLLEETGRRYTIGVRAEF